MSGDLCSQYETSNYYSVDLPIGSDATFTVSGQQKSATFLLSIQRTPNGNAVYSAVSENGVAVINSTVNDGKYFAGTYYITLKLVGNFDATVGYSFSVVTFPSGTPAVSMAQLGSNGVSVTLTFTMAVSPISTFSQQCSQILNATSVSLLGSNPSCAFVSANQLLISLGNNYALQPYNPQSSSPATAANEIVLASNTIFSSLNHPAFVGPYIVMKPQSFIPPVAVITGPTQISTCNNLVLVSASYGNAGHSFKSLTWTVSPTSIPNANSILSILAAASNSASGTVIIPGSLLSQNVSAYVFSLQVTNYLDQTSRPASLQVTAFASAIPTVTITANQVTAQGSPQITAPATGASFFVYGGATLTQCPGVSGSQTLSYQWSVVGEPSFQLDATSAKTQILYIPANSLVPGNVYVLQLTATIAGTATSAFSRVTLVAPPAVVSAVISGGMMNISVFILNIVGNFQISANTPFTLNAQQSTATGNAKLTFTWNCTAMTGVCPSMSQTTSTITVSAVAGQYRFTVFVQLASNPSISSSASTQVTVLAVQNLPTVQIISNTALSAPFDATKTLVLTGVVTSATNVQWSAIGLNLAAPYVIYVFSL